MKLAVSAQGGDLSSRVDERFGRANHILIVTGDGRLEEAIDNTANRNAMQGAGIGTAQLLADRHVDCLVTGHVGPKAHAALKIAGIRIYSATGMVCSEAVKAAIAGTLPDLGAPDVVSHW